MSQAFVSNINIVPIELPLQRPVVSAVGRYDKWPFIITEIALDNGIVGNSYSCPSPRQLHRPYRAGDTRAVQKLFENQPLAPTMFI